MVSKRQLPQEEIEKAVSDPGVFLQTVIEAGALATRLQGARPRPGLSGADPELCRSQAASASRCRCGAEDSDKTTSRGSVGGGFKRRFY